VSTLTFCASFAPPVGKGKVCYFILPLEFRRGAHLPPLLSVTHGHCDARPTIAFPAARHHRPLAGTKLYCLVTEAHVC